MKKTENTEERIINAAREVFLKKGMDGSRMQEIADEAGINKSLLHYYFRSKSKLFEKVFTETFKSLTFVINNVFVTADSLESLIKNFVVNYTAVLIDKPYIPIFVLHELSRNPQQFIELISSSNFDKNKIISLVSAEDEDTIEAFDPIQIIVDIIALCVFPFVAKPIIEGIIFDGSNDDYNNFIEHRTQHIIEFVNKAVFIKK